MIVDTLDWVDLSKRRRLLALAFALFTFVGGCSPQPELPGLGPDIGKVVVYRDTWGVPHIYGPSAVAGCYAMGWAQAQDRPQELLKNFLRGIGEISSVEGAGDFQSDWVARLWDNYGVSQRNYDKVSPEVQSYLTAYAAGVNDYYAAHPQDLPDWWGDRQVDGPMVIAFGRLFLFSWSINDGFGDLRRGGIRPGANAPGRGSNQFAVSPARSGVGAAILAIDPHLSWWGESRFWEFRIHAGKFQGSGFTLPGFPSIGLGHNPRLAWAMTTGGPDTADIYRLRLKPGDPSLYFHEGKWMPFEVREESFVVKGEPEPRKLRLLSSRYGPVVAVQDGMAYSMKMAYAEEVSLLEAWYRLNFAEDYHAVIEAVGTQQVFPQNVMAADDSGNIFYIRAGRVPLRPAGFDWSKPVDGRSDASDWTGLHDVADLVQILNPRQGYMQNCNIPPDAMMVDSPLQPGKYAPEIYSDQSHGPQGGWTNQRGARAVQLLAADESVTPEEAISYILDIHPYGVERWIEALRAASEANPNTGQDYSKALNELLAWDQRLDAGSQGALKYYYWRSQLRDDLGPQGSRRLSSQIDDLLGSLSADPPPPLKLEVKDQAALVQALGKAIVRLKSENGSLDKLYGDVFRVGRGDKSWPVGGGGPFDLGMTTLRNVNFGAPREDHTRWGNSGQTSTQVVVLSNPIQSWTAAPIGQSDRPDSPHFRDQAEKLFSPRQLKPTWWLPEDLAGHIESRTVLENPR